jgi:acetyl-CoA carboxylase biotin carboxylase subunit
MATTSNHKITKVLIANRAEIALRIQRACSALGIDAVSVCSEADKNSLFARKAQELAIIGPAPASESYLNIERIIEAAQKHGCDAVHPGYGFLSERAEFAAAVEQAGMIFIGPSQKSIEILGSKTAAREAVAAYGVPYLPGAAGGLSDAQLISRAKEVGFPVIIKAVGGGGGRGMRIARNVEQLSELLPRARAESKKNFSNDDVYFEKYLATPRHVEVQIFGDKYGSIVHFGTRGCSTQRRHQKLIEEAPAPDLSDAMREDIHQAAIGAARSVGYCNAGTVEFLVDGGHFYFLEVNTRIQVEHPVTEFVTNTDLVQLQIRIAQGERLPTQDQIRFAGHAMEFRIYAEDPQAEFRPAIGPITKLVRPKADWIREDFAFEQGDEVTPHYDAMLSKLIISGGSRKEVLARSEQALKSYIIKGLPTTIDFHRWALKNNDFKGGPIDIAFVEREFSAQSIRELKAGDVRDPLWQEPKHGAEVKNVYEYRSKKFATTYTIEVVHQSEGFFVAAPLDSKGQKARNSHCRMSNGLNTALSSLIEDVLEKRPPAEVFSH